MVLQVAAHNPTGADLSKAQWGVLAKALRAREDIAVLMDSAYQGYASGDLEADATPVRIFMEQDFEVPGGAVVCEEYGVVWRACGVFKCGVSG